MKQAQPAEPAGLSAEALQDRLVRIVGRCRAVDIRGLEECSRAELLASFLPLVRELLDEGLATADALLAQLEQARSRVPDLQLVRIGDDDPGSRDFDHAVDRVFASNDVENRIPDFAFIVAVELRRKSERIAALRADIEPIEILAEGASVVRSMTKAFSALENEIAARHGLATSLSFTSELESSLRIRRYYAGLRRRIVAAGDSPFFDRFRAVGTEFAVILGKPLYASLRITDRVHIRRFQVRVLDWLRDREHLDEKAPLRLWQDILGFAQMLSQISQRQELVEHDRAALTDAWRAVAEGDPRLDLGAEVLTRLGALEGLDDEVDELLAGACVDRARWNEPLRRLRSVISGLEPEDAPAEPRAELDVIF